MTDSSTEGRTTRRRLLKTTGSTGVALFGLAQGVSASDGERSGDGENSGQRGKILGQLTGKVAASQQYRHIRSVLREDGYRPELGRASLREIRSSDVPDELTSHVGDYLLVPCAKRDNFDHGPDSEELSVEAVGFDAESGGLEITAIARQSSVPIASIHTNEEIVKKSPGHIESPGGEH